MSVCVWIYCEYFGYLFKYGYVVVVVYAGDGFAVLAVFAVVAGYGCDGKLQRGTCTTLDLREGACIRVTDGHFKGEEGQVVAQGKHARGTEASEEDGGVPHRRLQRGRVRKGGGRRAGRAAGQGRLRAGLDALDAYCAGFPAGTLTGAPKIRAMEIIEELEPSRRGLYAGGVGYFGADGGMDTCIALRTALVKDGVMYVQAGAGVVADSDPKAEYEETRQKARALFRAAEEAVRFASGRR